MKAFKYSYLDFIFGILLISVFTSSLVLAYSSVVIEYPELFTGIAFDLSIVAPLLYFMLIRKKNIPKLTVLTVAVLGIIIAHLITPEAQQKQLDIFRKFLLPFLEIVVVSMIFYKSFLFVRKLNKKTGKQPDFYLAIKNMTRKEFKNQKLSQIIANELAIFYYSFIVWKRKPFNKNEFTLYKENGSIALLLAFIMVVIVETVVLHALLLRWNTIIAWIATVSSIYVIAQLIAHIKALVFRKSMVTKKEVFLKSGLFGDITFKKDMIDSIALSSSEYKDENLYVSKLSMLGNIEAHNVRIHFKETQYIEWPYGKKRPCDVLLVSVDNREAFKEKINL